MPSCSGVKVSKLWRAFVRILIAFLVVIVGVLLVLSSVPGVLQELILVVSGNAEIPEFGTVPAPPVIDVPRGEIPPGAVAFTGQIGSVSFACGFLLELEDGHRSGLSAAHATPESGVGVQAVFQSHGGGLRVLLDRQIGRGEPFYRQHFVMDYVVWSVADGADPGLFFKPDLRGQAQPGERVRVFGRSENAEGEAQSWPGVVMLLEPEATWIQLEDSFDPVGYSGCPVVSETTGRVVGMAVAGTDRPPVVMGLHPVGSLVEKAEEALDRAAIRP